MSYDQIMSKKVSIKSFYSYILHKLDKNQRLIPDEKEYESHVIQSCV
jgi:hypothetical protein